MNNKAHLRPDDYDSNGDIIPTSWEEEKGDLISREALLKALEEERQYLLANGQTGAEHILVHHCLRLVDNAPTVRSFTEEDIRWTDKHSVTSSGDIVDFNGQVVGHINLEYIRGGAE